MIVDWKTIPDGWTIKRVGNASMGDMVLWADGTVVEFKGSEPKPGYVILERPVLTESDRNALREHRRELDVAKSGEQHTAYRVPKRGEWFISKLGYIMLCDSDLNPADVKDQAGARRWITRNCLESNVVDELFGSLNTEGFDDGVVKDILWRVVNNYGMVLTILGDYHTQLLRRHGLKNLSD